MIPVILDVDTGIDDALAIAYAVRSPELELIGVTTCFGNIPVEEATRNSLAVLERLRCDAPVIAGADRPLGGPKRGGYPRHIHGDNGLGNVRFAAPVRRAQDGHAADFIIEQVRKRPGQVTLIAVGPLTNLAIALRKDPEIAAGIGRVVVMGGAVRVPGNVTPHAEANIRADPEAAAIVLDARLPLTLVGLDVTMKTLLPASRLQAWREKDPEAGAFFADMTAFYIDAYERAFPGIGGCALHDPLAVGVAIDPAFVREVPMHVRVVREGEAAGRTEERPEGEPNARVCVDVDAERFVAHFLSRVI